jgi:hypothetical protein
MKYETIVRGKITYYLTDSAAVVWVGGNQYISYNIYNTPSRSDLGAFKKKIKASKPEQFASVVDMMDLAQQFKLVGAGTVKPSWIK